MILEFSLLEFPFVRTVWWILSFSEVLEFVLNRVVRCIYLGSFLNFVVTWIQTISLTEVLFQIRDLVCPRHGLASDRTPWDITYHVCRTD